MAGPEMPTMTSSNTTLTRRSALLLVLATAGLALGGCRNEMYNQEKAEPFEINTVFADSLASRPLIEGTVPRSGRVAGAPDAVVRDSAASVQWGLAESGAIAQTGGDTVSGGAPGGATTTGATPGARPRVTDAQLKTASIPIAVTREVLDRGRERYNIYCSPCHGQTGDGNGMIVQRGFPQPPSFHLERLRTAADGHYYDVITHGFGTMYSYAARVKPTDRWAITAYIRALQLSRTADTPARTTP
jgi:mono/diheme cytochrome c family protein